jgi:hypothetical protein
VESIYICPERQQWPSTILKAQRSGALLGPRYGDVCDLSCQRISWIATNTCLDRFNPRRYVQVTTRLEEIMMKRKSGLILMALGILALHRLAPIQMQPSGSAAIQSVHNRVSGMPADDSGDDDGDDDGDSGDSK